MSRYLAAPLIAAGSLVIAACGSSSHLVTTTKPHQTTTTATLPSLSSPVVTASELGQSFGLVGLVNSRTVGHIELELTTDFVHWHNIIPPVPDQGQYGGSAAIKDVFFLSPAVGWVVVGLPNSTLELYRTSNGGISWQGEGGDTSGGTAGDELVDFVDMSHGWREIIAPTAGRVSLSATANGGESWAPITNPDQWPSGGILSFSGPTSGFLADTLPPHQDLVSDQPINSFAPLRQTTDGGQTWHQATVDLPAGFGSAQSYQALPTFSSASDGVLPVVLFKQNSVSLAFFTTANAGSSWMYQSLLSLGSTGNTGVGLYNQLPSVAAAGQSTWWVISSIRPDGPAVVHVTKNAGKTWTSLKPNGLPSIFSSALPTGYAPVQAASASAAWMTLANGPDCGLFGTSDGGATWTPVCPS